MNVRLLTRWNGYMANDIVSVSDDRAEYMEKEGICRIIDRPAEGEIETVLESVVESVVDAVVKEMKPRKK